MSTDDPLVFANSLSDEYLALVERAVKNATNTPEPPAIDIQPTLTMTASEPLFTTGDSFAAACLKLIASKRLMDLDDVVDEP